MTSSTTADMCSRRNADSRRVGGRSAGVLADGMGINIEQNLAVSVEKFNDTNTTKFATRTVAYAPRGEERRRRRNGPTPDTHSYWQRSPSSLIDTTRNCGIRPRFTSSFVLFGVSPFSLVSVSIVASRGPA